MAQQLLTTKDVAKTLSISERQVYYQMKEGNIAYLNIGRSRRIKVSEVNKFIALMEQRMRAHNKEDV